MPNAINRYTFSLARDGVLPKALHRTDPKTGSPVASGLLQTVLAVIVVGIFAVLGLDPYMQLLLWVNSPGVVGIIVLQILTCVAVVVYFAKHRHLARRWYVLPAAIVAGLLQAVVLYLLCASNSHRISCGDMPGCEGTATPPGSRGHAVRDDTAGLVASSAVAIRTAHANASAAISHSGMSRTRRCIRGHLARSAHDERGKGADLHAAQAGRREEAQ